MTDTKKEENKPGEEAASVDISPFGLPLRKLVLVTDGKFVAIKTNEMAGDIEAIAVMKNAIAIISEQQRAEIEELQRRGTQQDKPKT